MNSRLHQHGSTPKLTDKQDTSRLFQSLSSWLNNKDSLSIPALHFTVQTTLRAESRNLKRVMPVNRVKLSDHFQGASGSALVPSRSPKPINQFPTAPFLLGRSSNTLEQHLISSVSCIEGLWEACDKEKVK